MKTTWEIEAWIRKQYDAGSKDKTLQLYFGGAKFYCEIGDICAGSATLSGAIENAMTELRERDAKRPVAGEFPVCPKCNSLPDGGSAIPPSTLSCPVHGSWEFLIKPGTILKLASGEHLKWTGFSKDGGRGWQQVP